MDILTKICVVLLVVLVLVASTVFINQATVPQRWKDLYNEQKQRAEIAEQLWKVKAMLADRLQGELRDAVAKADQAAQGRNQDVSRVEAELNAERVKVAGFQNEIQKYNAELIELRTNLDHFNKRTEKLSADLDDSRKKVGEMAEENRHLTEALNKARTDFGNVEKLARLRHEQLVKAEEQIRSLEEQIQSKGAQPVAGAEVVLAASAGPTFTGTILDVKDDQASINIGSAKGVKKGDRLIIYRGSLFVGHLDVSLVDINQAAGMVVSKQLDPMQGDKVTNNLNPK